MTQRSKCVLAALRKFNGFKDNNELKQRRDKFVDIIDITCKMINGWSLILIPPLSVLQKLEDEINKNINDNNNEKLQKLLMLIDEFGGSYNNSFSENEMQLGRRNKFDLKTMDVEFIEFKPLYGNNNDIETYEDKSDKPKRKSRKGKGKKSIDGGEMSEIYQFEVMKAPKVGELNSSSRVIKLIFIDDELTKRIIDKSEHKVDVTLSGGCGCDNAISGGYYSNLRQVYDIMKVLAQKKQKVQNVFQTDLVSTCMEFCNGFYATMSEANKDIYDQLIFLKCDSPVLTLINIISVVSNPKFSVTGYKEETSEWNFSSCPIKVEKIWNLQMPEINSSSLTGNSCVEKFKSLYTTNSGFSSFAKNVFDIQSENEIKEDNNKFLSLVCFNVRQSKSLKMLNDSFSLPDQSSLFEHVCLLHLVTQSNFELPENMLFAKTSLQMNNLPYVFGESESQTELTNLKISNDKIEKYLATIKD